MDLLPACVHESESGKKWKEKKIGRQKEVGGWVGLGCTKEVRACDWLCLWRKTVRLWRIIQCPTDRPQHGPRRRQQCHASLLRPGKTPAFPIFFFLYLYLYFPLLCMSRNPTCYTCTYPPRVLLLHIEGLERDVKKARGAGKGKESKGWCNCRLKSKHPGYGFMSMSCGAVRCGAGQDSNRNLQQREEDSQSYESAAQNNAALPPLPDHPQNAL